MGLPVYWQVSVSSAEVEKSISCAEQEEKEDVLMLLMPMMLND